MKCVFNLIFMPDFWGIIIVITIITISVIKG